MLFPQLLGRSFQKAFRLFWFQQPGAQPWQKSWNFGVNLALDMLLVCSDIQVLGSPLMSVKVTKMQDLVGLYEFSQNFRGWYPGPPQREGAPPLAPIHSQACGRTRGHASRCWGPILGLSQLFSHGCAPAICNRCFHGPTRVMNANGISIASKFSAGLI